jgi:ribosomal subunit interface protein
VGAKTRSAGPGVHFIGGRSAEAVDVIVKGRGVQVTDQIRRVAEHKLAKLERLDPQIRKLEVEIMEERNPRIDGSHRVDVAADTARKVFRAHGTGRDVDSALDEATRRLERQIGDFRSKLRDRHKAGPPPPTARA